MTNKYNPEETQGLNAGADFNGDFYEIFTSSGRGLLSLDPDAPRHYLLPDATNLELGERTLEALLLSKVWSSEFIQNYLKAKIHEQVADIHVNEVMQRFNYKSKKDYFKNLHHCSIQLINNQITISPWHKKNLYAREGIGATPEERAKVNVVISANSSPTEIGAALRLAFSRCTG